MLLKRGFTLIELLVAISIIGLLSSIVLASVNKARDTAKNAATTASMRTWLTALNAYRLEHGEFYVTSAQICMGVGECHLFQGVPNGSPPVSAAFVSAMDRYIPGTPNPMREFARWDSNNEHKAVYETYPASGDTFNGEIIWFLHGAASCGFGAFGVQPGQFGNSSKYTYCSLTSI